MREPISTFESEIIGNIITEVFKTCLIGLKEADKWFQNKRKENDFFGIAADNYKNNLINRYDTIRIFGMTKPVSLRNIYTRLNILTKITSRQRISVNDLEKHFDRDNRSFGYSQFTKTGLAVVSSIQKLIILGKPGAGKTTFLKYLAIQAASSNLNQPRIPIFISIKDFADANNSSIEFIIKQFEICNFPDPKLFVLRILEKGKALLLLDGLDEVGTDKVDFVLKEIRDLADKYNKNQIIISCRIAAYNYCFEKFTDVEIADFDENQIEDFVRNWYGNEHKKTTLFLKKIKEENSIKEIARIPLLLTMLCLAFDETMEFPNNKAELYKEAIDALLKKWDSSRSIKRENQYKCLSIRRKESLFCHIANNTFENGQYFLPQRILEKHISSFIKNMPDFDEEKLDYDSEAILKSIESQHGILVERANSIYSFSHLTFQEYFTAKYIVEHEANGKITDLINNNLTNDKWREVFLIIVGMLENADQFILGIKNKIQKSLIPEGFKEIIKQINEVIIRDNSTYPRPVCRLLILCYILVNAIEVFRKRMSNLHIDPEIDVETKEMLIEYKPDSIRKLESTPNLLLVLMCNYYPPIIHDLQLREFHLPLIDFFSAQFNRIYKNAMHCDKARAISRTVTLESLDQMELYIKANLLLIDCISSDCYDLTPKIATKS